MISRCAAQLHSDNHLQFTRETCSTCCGFHWTKKTKILYTTVVLGVATSSFCLTPSSLPLQRCSECELLTSSSLPLQQCSECECLTPLLFAITKVFRVRVPYPAPLCHYKGVQNASALPRSSLPLQWCSECECLTPLLFAITMVFRMRVPYPAPLCHYNGVQNASALPRSSLPLQRCSECECLTPSSLPLQRCSECECQILISDHVAPPHRLSVDVCVHSSHCNNSQESVTEFYTFN